MKYSYYVFVLFGCLFVCFLAFPCMVYSTTSIKGLVKDADTRESLVGVTIRVDDHTASGTYSALDGTFHLSVNHLPVVLVCSYVGYTTQEYRVENEGEECVVLLEPVSLDIGEVVVTGMSKNTEAGVRSIEKNAVNVINVVSAKAIEISPDMTVANVVQRVSGVTVERSSTGDGQYAVLRGMDKRYNYTLINGVKIPSPDNKNRFVPLDIFPSELLDRLEVTKALTADMEGDAVGGAVDMVMKDAPSYRQFTVNVAGGYNALFFDRDFLRFDHKKIQKRSPYDQYGLGYAAKPRDFSPELIRLQAANALPALFAGFSFGDRFLLNRLGVMLAGSYQNACRGSNSAYFSNQTATSDASNLPVLTDANDRTYSERQIRCGIHLKLDYKFNYQHSIQWYNALMDLSALQVRDNVKTDLNVGYNPLQGDYNLSFDTRFRYNRQRIANSTLKGKHRFFDGKIEADWAAVYSRAFNETPENTSVHTVATVRGHKQNSTSVVTLGGADRRWERNSDEDRSVLLNFRYRLEGGRSRCDFSTGGLYRDKRRTNFFNQYDFRPYDDSKPEGMKNNLIKGLDWNDYSEISFLVFTPYGSIGNPLNYDASEKIAAAYGQANLSFSRLKVMLGVRVEHTNQGYNLKYAIDGVKNVGNQVYTDVLPSLHLNYPLSANAQLKASYFKSINRPGFFEIVPYRIINEDYVEMGNPDLKHTVAHNFDLRAAYFPQSTEQLMLGLFYKKLNDPIEYGTVAQGQSSFYAPDNFGDAVNYGLEADLTKYFRTFGVKANYTFTHSEITTSKLSHYDHPDPAATDRILIRNVEQTRPLNGQARHVANVSLLYKNVGKGWDGQLSFSYTGERLYAVSRFKDNDIWQGDYLQTDASLEKRFRSKWSVYAKATNLLDVPMTLFLKRQNPSNELVDGYENYKGGTLVRKNYYGQTFLIGCRYKF